MLKIVVFVPEAHEAAVRQAMSHAGAGGVGRYRECSFSVAGTGGFRPIEGANPAIGKVGQREEVAERRLEMLIPSGHQLTEVVEALRAAHPYEEPAFDLLPMVPPPNERAIEHPIGAGRLLEFGSPLEAAELVTRFGRSRFPEAVIKLGSQGSGPIRTVAVCPGSGGSLFEKVEADAYVTGEMQHHQALDLVQRGKTVILLGHTASERPYLSIYRDRIRQSLADHGEAAPQWHLSEADAAPLTLQSF